MLRAVVLASILVIAGSDCPDECAPIEGSCYQFLPDRVGTWYEARDNCTSENGHLAFIKSCTTLGNIARHIHLNFLEAENTGYWIGCSDNGNEGAWYWMDGSTTELGVPFWGSDEENNMQPNGGEEENCGILNKDNQYYMHDWDCNDDVLSFLCECDSANN